MKLFYSVLDRRSYGWKKTLSSILMEKALVDSLDRIFEQPKYTEDIKIRGYIPKKGSSLLIRLNCIMYK